MSEVVIGWMRDDGTITFDRDEIAGHFRRVVRGFKNSDGFIQKLDREYDERFSKSRSGRNKNK